VNRFTLEQGSRDASLAEICGMIRAPLRLVRATPRPQAARNAAKDDDKARLSAVTLSLAKTRPEYSARRVFTAGQIFWLLLLATLLTGAFFVAPIPTASLVIVLTTLFYLASFLFKTFLFSTSPKRLVPPAQSEQAPNEQEVLPIYTVLIPLYREAAALPGLLAGLARLDYPKDRLDVKFILESDDFETAAALARLPKPPQAQTLFVPVLYPRTKPKALMYGLSFARGSYLVVYDAEDQPEPDQLRQALARFAALGPRTACLQARLNFYNARENWLCRLFAIDYCLWFDYLLPSLERLGAPVPLGGTSNHFRRDALLATGGWDPFNVTEDADLGIRLAREGYHVGTLASTTYEEAPSCLAAWLSQRSRWMKGYLQTYLVHNRDRGRLKRETGRTGLLVLDVFLFGSVAAGLANPLLWTLFLAWTGTGEGVLDRWSSSWCSCRFWRRCGGAGSISFPTLCSHRSTGS
jgi:cellulose synthase/poly-beta-1,6-N-acetylglucosamine synthase-like glycosyltransferase